MSGGGNKGGGGLGDAFRLAANLLDVVEQEGRKQERAVSGGATSDEQVIDVRVAGTATTVPIRCLTCGDTEVVGTPGHEVPCPACTPGTPCSTCKGKRKLGAKGHEVVCPKCRGTGKNR